MCKDSSPGFAPVYWRHYEKRNKGSNEHEYVHKRLCLLCGFFWIEKWSLKFISVCQQLVIQLSWYHVKDRKWRFNSRYIVFSVWWYSKIRFSARHKRCNAHLGNHTESHSIIKSIVKWVTLVCVGLLPYATALVKKTTLSGKSNNYTDYTVFLWLHFWQLIRELFSSIFMYIFPSNHICIYLSIYLPIYLTDVEEDIGL